MPRSASRSRSPRRSRWPLSPNWSWYRSPTRFSVHSKPAQSSRGCTPLPRAYGGGRRGPEPLEDGERLGDDLIHVVVLVRREPPHEVDARHRIGELPVALVQLRVLRLRHGVVRVALGLRILVDDRRLRVLLPRQVLELGDPRVWVLVRVVDDWRRLVNRPVERLEAKLERTVGQLAVAQIEELVDRTRVDGLLERKQVGDFAVIRLQQELDVLVPEDALKHARVAVARHRLVDVAEVAVVAVRACRDARGDGRVQLGGVEPPLLTRVVAEELEVELAANRGDDDVLGRPHLLDRLRDRGEEGLYFPRVEAEAVELVDGVEVDRNRHEPAVDARPYPVLVRPPLRELGEVVEDLLRVRVEDVRPVAVHEDARVVVVVVRVAPDVRAAVDNEDTLVRLGREALGEDTAGEPGT